MASTEQFLKLNFRPKIYLKIEISKLSQFNSLIANKLAMEQKSKNLSVEAICITIRIQLLTLVIQ